MLFINQNFDLMKKANFSLVVASVMFLLFVGVNSVSAQGSFFQNDITHKDMNIDGIQLVDVDDAIQILSAEYKDLYQETPASDAAEANQSARLAYYEFLLENLHAGAGVGDVLPNSAGVLIGITSRYDQSAGVDPVAIYDETVQFLEQ